MDALALAYVIALAGPLPESPPLLCEDYESPIEEGHRWHESDFTYDRAKAAASRMQEIVEGEYYPEWYELSNLFALVEGFHLRRSALNSMERGNGPVSTYHISAFCTFLASRPVVD
jgi:hypothetical protein